MTRAVRALFAAMALGVAGFGPTVASAQTATSLEYGVKANYLVRFAAFIQWPAPAFAGPDSDLVICVAGRDPFGRGLDQAAAGQSAQGHPIAVRRVPAGQSAEGCHILYAAADAPAALHQTAPGRLLVMEAGGPGAIVFVIRDGRVRFEIDQDSARRAGLVMSSRLLDLAVVVRGR